LLKLREEEASKIKALEQELATIKASEEQVVEELETVQQAADASSLQITAARRMIEKANAILAQTEPAHAESLKRLDILTAQSVLLVKDETAKAGELEEAKARLTSTLALAEDGLRGQALATVEAERDKELSVLELKLKSYISR
jgi:chromosome segregation ATPase